jgi:hypothetical protein
MVAAMKKSLGMTSRYFGKTNREWTNYVSRLLKRTLSASFRKHWTVANRRTQTACFGLNYVFLSLGVAVKIAPH